MSPEGYPEDDDLAQAKALPFDFEEGARWMLDQFEATGIGSGSLESDGTLTLHTGGWSGCEELIGAAMESIWWMRWWYSTTRGGHFIFGDPV